MLSLKFLNILRLGVPLLILFLLISSFFNNSNEYKTHLIEDVKRIFSSKKNSKFRKENSHKKISKQEPSLITEEYNIGEIFSESSFDREGYGGSLSKFSNEIYNLKSPHNIRREIIISEIKSIKYEGSNINELALKLKAIGQTELEHAFVIYVWITENIAYDIESYIHNNFQIPNSNLVLTTKKAICGGYAKLFKDLSDIFKLNSHIVIGFAKGIDYHKKNSSPYQFKTNHDWNIIKLYGSNYLIDCTWGAGFLSGNEFIKKFNLYFFLTDPVKLIITHFPSDKSQQLLLNPITFKKFIDLIDVSTFFFEYGFKKIFPNKNEFQVNNHLNLYLEVSTKRKVKLLVELIDIFGQHLKSEKGSYTFYSQSKNIVTIKVTFPKTGKYNVKLFALNPELSEGSYDEIFQIFVEAEISDNFRTKFPKRYEHDHYFNIISPSNGILKLHHEYKFQIEIDGYTNAYFISGEVRTKMLHTQENHYQCNGLVLDSDPCIYIENKYGHLYCAVQYFTE